MGRWLRRIGIVLLALFVVAAGLWGASRLRGPTAEQRQALELFQDMSPPEGSNAFPALWLLKWDVPEAEQAALVAEDVERLHSRLRGDEVRPVGPSPAEDIAEGRYADLEARLAADPPSCGWREGGCLEQVRSDRDGYAARLGQASRLLERVEAVTDHDHYRNPFPQSMDQPTGLMLSGEWALMRLGMTRHALQFVDGDVDAAIAGNCRALAGWRRLAGNSDSLLVAMLATDGARGHGRLLADMLAEIPAHHPLPAACEVALAPVKPDEMGLCRAMRGEWALGQSTLDGLEAGSVWSELATWVLFDPRASAALSAEVMSWPCSEYAKSALAEDRHLRLPQEERGLARFECVANVAGCILADLAAPAYVDYGLRMQDARARIQLLRVLAWMRVQAADGWTGTAEDLLVLLPADLSGSTRAVDIDPATGHLRMELFHDRPDTHWSIPLPAELRTDDEGAAGT